MGTSTASSTILNLGCGNDPMGGAVNHDLGLYQPWVDVPWDLNVFPWPWDDNSFQTIVALDLLEHLDSFIRFFDECWRIIKPSGRIAIRTPRWDSPNAVIDPTHKRCYHPESFDYLDPSTVWGQKYSMYTPRKWRKVEFVDNGVNMHVTLKAIKPDVSE